MSYSRNGNINTRTGMGTYTYGSASRPHAVTAVYNTSGDIDFNSQDVSYKNWNRVSSVCQYYDCCSITGLAYNYYMAYLANGSMYDPRLGRFLSPDPL